MLREISIRRFVCSLLMIVTIVFYFLFVNTSMELRQLCMVSTLGIIIGGYLLWKKSRTLTGGFLYYLSLCLMHCGQIFIVAFNMEFSKERQSSIAIGTSYSHTEEAIIFTTLACMFSALVFLMFEKERKDTALIVFHNEETDDSIAFSQITWLCVSGIVLLVIVSDITRMAQVAIYGYGLGYRQNNTLLYYADLLFPLCVFFIISVYKNNEKVMMGVLYGVIARAICCALFIGSRSDAVLDVLLCSFAILTLSSKKIIQKKTKKTALTIVLAGVILLPFTGLLRNDSAWTLSKFLAEINPVSYILTEFGGSIVNVRTGIEYGGQLPFGDFILSFLSIFPMSGFLFPFLRTTYGNSYAAYINKVRGYGGLGGSVIGEAAFWFGNSFGGIVYIVLISSIVVWVINRMDRYRRSKNYIGSTVVLFLLYDLFYMIRGAVASLQGGIKIAIMFWILLTVFEKYLIRRNIV